MIVASSASQRLPMITRPMTSNCFVDIVHLQLFFVLLFQVCIAHSKKSCGDHLLRAPCLIGGIHQVTGDLLADEQINRAIFIKGVDQVVAIIARPAARQTRATSRFSIIAPHHPVTSHALAESRRSQQAIRLRAHTCLVTYLVQSQQLFFARWQSQQVKCQATQ